MKNKKKIEYTVDWFINYLKKIPSNKWCQYLFEDDKGRCCVLGHLGMKSNYYHGLESLPAKVLQDLFDSFINVDPIIINNDPFGRFQQKTPKARIMAALNYIKKLQAA